MRAFAVSLAAITFVMSAAGCFIGAGSFAGKNCDSNIDCPDPYVCASVRAGGRSCELLHGIDLTSNGSGGGGGTTVPDYCHDVKKILDRSCISNCHGMDTTGSGLPYRYDVSSLGGTPPGAFEVSDTIKTRVSDDSMPPFGSMPRPTPAERAIVLRWVNTGAKECSDGGGSTVTDAGTDGGAKPDGGDGGDGG